MKKLISFLLIFVLAFSFSFSALAYENGTDFYDITELVALHEEEYPYYCVGESEKITGLWRIIFSSKPFVATSVGKPSVENANYIVYTSRDFSPWEVSTDSPQPTFTLNALIRYSNVDIYDSDGNLFHKSDVYVYVECDGTACPANDADHDNICDDCGNVLTFSLRSTLLNYAQTLAETNSAFSSTHTYYAVVEHPTDSDKYVLYISQIQMGTTDGGTSVTGGDMYRCIVVTRDDGSFANQGFGAVDSWSGKVVYANHTIPFFFRVPLTVSLQGPTGEQMEMEAPNLTEEFSTLALCGIGCLALLIILRLFRVSLTNFLH